jgi:hypothetical protein
MPITRRVRGALIRLARRRAWAISIGAALALPAVIVQTRLIGVPWWLEGLSLVAGATGVALFWTGIAGTRPDWIE